MRTLEQELRARLDKKEDRLMVVDLGRSDAAIERLTVFGSLELPKSPRALIL